MNHKLFCIGLSALTATVVSTEPEAQEQILVISETNENPPKLGYEVVLDENNEPHAGDSILHIDNFRDETEISAEAWEQLCRVKYRWQGKGGESRVVHSEKYSNMIFLPDMNVVTRRPPNMPEDFAEPVFVFKAGTLPWQVEPISGKYIEQITRDEDTGLVKVTVVSLSSLGWNGHDADAAPRDHFYFKEIDLLLKWHQGYLTHDLIGKPLDMNSLDIRTLDNPHPVPNPKFDLQVTTNHPYIASHVLSDEGTIISIEEAVINELNQGTRTHG